MIPKELNQAKLKSWDEYAKEWQPTDIALVEYFKSARHREFMRILKDTGLLEHAQGTAGE